MKLRTCALFVFLFLLPYLSWYLIFSKNLEIAPNLSLANALLVLGAILQGSIAALTIIFVGLTIAFSRVKEESKIFTMKDVLIFDTSGRDFLRKLGSHLKNLLIRLLQYDLTMSIMYMAIFILISVFLILHIIQGIAYPFTQTSLSSGVYWKLANANYERLVSHALGLASLSITYLVFGLFSFFLTFLNFAIMTKRRKMIESLEEILDRYCRDLLSRNSVISILRMIDERLENGDFPDIARLCILVEIIRQNKGDLFKSISENMNVSKETLKIIECNVYRGVLPENLKNRYLARDCFDFEIDLPPIIFPENLLFEEEDRQISEESIDLFKQISRSNQELAILILLERIGNEDLSISSRTIEILKFLFRLNNQVFVTVLYNSLKRKSCFKNGIAMILREIYIFKMAPDTKNQLIDLIEMFAREMLAEEGEIKTGELLTESVGQICLILEESKRSEEFKRLYYILTMLRKNKDLEKIALSYIERL